MQRWVGAKILVALGMLTSLVFGLVTVLQKDRTPPRWSLEGRTEQGFAIHMDVDERGKLRTFDTRVAGMCANGATRSVGWRPSGNGAPARFTGRGPRFEAEEVKQTSFPDGSYSHLTLKLAGRVSRTEASGTVRYVARYRLTDGSTTRCESRAVPWSAPRG